jgi:hypothetical protein
MQNYVPKLWEKICENHVKIYSKIPHVDPWDGEKFPIADFPPGSILMHEFGNKMKENAKNI